MSTRILNSRLTAEIYRKADGRYVRIACQSEHQLPAYSPDFIGLSRASPPAPTELREQALWARRNRP